MLLYIDKLYKELETQLKSIALTQTDILNQAEFSSSACDLALLKLKELVLKFEFKNEAEEITFFKKIKPKFSSKLYYYIILYEVERRRPKAGTKAQVQYLENVQSKLDIYFQENLDFCTYYRTDNTLLDDKYFVRNKLNLHFAYDEVFFNYDRDFCTNRDSKVAHIMANDLISVYISNELKKIEEAKQVQVPTISSNLKWTDSKVSLTVLIYALHSASSFNNGNVELKEIASTFSKLCNIDLGDFYRTWAEIKLKKDPTKFLDILKMAVENRINEDMR